MRYGASFAEVLDATLGGYQPEPVAREAQPVGPAAPVPPNPFLFTINVQANAVPRPRHVADARPVGIPSGATVTTGNAAHARASVPREEPARPATGATRLEAPVLGRPTVAPPRPRRTLTSVQQRSLDAFVDAGASIGPDFSADELRSAYRRLARRFHPDRHPLASDGEKAVLSHRFATITTDYEVLLTALDAAAC